MAVVALVTMVSSPLSMRRCLHSCQASVVALIAHHRVGIIPLVMMALLQSMRRWLCHCCNWDCCTHYDGVVAIVDAQASLPSLRWHCCSCNNGIVALDLQQHCCPCCDGFVAIPKLALSPSLQLRHCHHHCTGILAIITMVLLPLLQWHCCH